MRIVLVGCGRWGGTVGRRLLELSRHVPGVELVGVVDPRIGEAAWLGVPVFASSRAAAEATGAESAILATPALMGRRKQISDLMGEGYGRIRVEKPLALSHREARKISGLAAWYGVDVYVGHQTVRAPEAVAFRKLVDAVDVASYTSVRTTVHASPDPWWDLAIHDAAQVAACDLRVRPTMIARDNAAAAIRSTTVVTTDGDVLHLDEQARTLEYPGGIARYCDEIDPLGACLSAWIAGASNSDIGVAACRILSRRQTR